MKKVIFALFAFSSVAYGTESFQEEMATATAAYTEAVKIYKDTFKAQAKICRLLNKKRPAATYSDFEEATRRLETAKKNLEATKKILAEKKRAAAAQKLFDSKL